MGIGKPQLHAKFEVAGFIFYINIRKLVFKNWDKPKWGNPLVFFAETDFTIGFPDPIFHIQCATFVELQYVRLNKMGDFYEKLHFTIKKN